MVSGPPKLCWVLRTGKWLFRYIIIMNNVVNILSRRPFLALSLSVLLLSICTHHYLIRIGINITLLVVLAGLVTLISLVDEVKEFIVGFTKKPKKYFLLLCILVSALGGLIISSSNILETGLFLIVFYSTYLFYHSRDSDLINLINKLIIYSGVFMSFGVLIGLFESLPLDRFKGNI